MPKIFAKNRTSSKSESTNLSTIEKVRTRGSSAQRKHAKPVAKNKYVNLLFYFCAKNPSRALGEIIPPLRGGIYLILRARARGIYQKDDK